MTATTTNPASPRKPRPTAKPVKPALLPSLNEFERLISGECGQFAFWSVIEFSFLVDGWIEAQAVNEQGEQVHLRLVMVAEAHTLNQSDVWRIVERSSPFLGETLRSWILAL